MFLEDLVDRDQADAIGRRLLAGFTEPVRTIAGDVPVSASIGIHVATDADDYDAVLRAADGAMYDAKRSGPGGIRFSPS
jgi:GGDEF domain-containing protein